MRMVVTIFIAAILLGCNKEQSLKMISSVGSTAESVYLTHDHKNNAVIVWTERRDDELTLFFSAASNEGTSLSDKVSLPLTNDVATHSEGMPKIAFKKDGTIIAAYEKKAPTESNKYAGAIYYRVSSDGGNTWQDEQFLHSDTIAGRSRSYFDIEQLADGEIGASWLDIKLNVETGGRSVRFAKTNSLNAFTNEILIDSSACQCCRLDVYSDIAGRVNVAYRGLMKGNMGQSVRDMMIVTSDNNGESFTTPTKISNDNWMIDGCPHTGPSLCSSKAGLFSFWYTEGNGTGIYYSFKQNGEDQFGKRELISNDGRHPQLSANETKSIMVWEENVGQTEQKFTNVYYQIAGETNSKRACLTPEKSNAFSPVVTQVDNGFLVAFLMEAKAGTGIYSTIISQ